MRATAIDLEPQGQRYEDGVGVPFSWRPIVTVDEVPDILRNYHILELSHFMKERCWIYFGVQDQLVDFGVWREKNTRGYGGRLFSRYVKHVWTVDKDGNLEHHEHSTEPHSGSWWKFNGPWSSRPGVMNEWAVKIPELGWPLSVDVTLRLEGKEHSLVAANVTVGWLYDTIHRLKRQDDIELVRNDRKQEPTWEVKPYGTR